MASRSVNQEGKEAVTEYIVKNYVGGTSGENHGYSLVEVKIKTGRTHQIRAHMQSLGHPVVGDTLYRLKKQKKRNDLNRVFLHAEELGFFDRKGEWCEYQSKLPKKLTDFLKSKGHTFGK